MKTYLLPEQGTFYKANLHCHTTFSDGWAAPEEIRARYLAEGYSIVAFTDHDVLVPHPELRTEDFLPLSGTELTVAENGNPRDRGAKQVHLGCIALEENTVCTPCFDAQAVWIKHDALCPLAKPDPGTADVPRRYGAENINRIIAAVRQAGFFVTYNHPDWSLEEQEDFRDYDGMNAMEIYNTHCDLAGYETYQPHAYDAILRRGRNIFCLATDDNHNRLAAQDSFGGWVMIKAEKLDYRTVTKALEAGSFYASQGPEIFALYLEDGEIHVECSEASRIRFTTAIRHRKLEVGEALTHSSFAVTEADRYVRVTVTDRFGRNANTNAYFL